MVFCFDRIPQYALFESVDHVPYMILFIHVDVIDYDSLNNIRQGSTIHSGHCYSYVKVDNDWICFNDSYAHQENPTYSLDAVVGLYYVKNNLN